MEDFNSIASLGIAASFGTNIGLQIMSNNRNWSSILITSFFAILCLAMITLPNLGNFIISLASCILIVGLVKIADLAKKYDDRKLERSKKTDINNQ